MNEGLPREGATCHNSPPLAFNLNQCPLPHPPTCVCHPRGLWGGWNSASISQLSYACYLHVRHIASPLNQSCSFCVLRNKKKSKFDVLPRPRSQNIHKLHDMTSSYTSSVLWWYERSPKRTLAHGIKTTRWATLDLCSVPYGERLRVARTHNRWHLVAYQTI